MKVKVITEIVQYIDIDNDGVDEAIIEARQKSYGHIKDMMDDGLYEMKYESVKSTPYILPDGIDVMSTQVGGKHYSSLAIQPHDYFMANKIGYPFDFIIKYATRAGANYTNEGKGNKDDVLKEVNKIIDFCNMYKVSVLASSNTIGTGV